MDLLLPFESQPVQDKNLSGQEKTGDAAPVQGHGQEVQGAAPVHRSARDIEGETGDGSVHQDTKVVTQVGARDTQGPHAGQDEDIADGEQDVRDQRLVDGLIDGLVVQGLVVQVVTENTQGEDGDREEVASVVWASKDTGEIVLAVLFFFVQGSGLACERQACCLGQQKLTTTNLSGRQCCVGRENEVRKTFLRVEITSGRRGRNLLLPEDRVERNGQCGDCNTVSRAGRG